MGFVPRYERIKVKANNLNRRSDIQFKRDMARQERIFLQDFSSSCRIELTGSL